MMKLNQALSPLRQPRVEGMAYCLWSITTVMPVLSSCELTVLSPARIKKNRVLVNTVLVRISRAVDGKHLSAGIRHTVFRIALTVPLLPESGDRRGCKAGEHCTCQYKPA